MAHSKRHVMSRRRTSRKRQKQRVERLSRKSIVPIVIVAVVLALLVIWAYDRQASQHESHQRQNAGEGKEAVPPK